jgi:hypothetical protein
MILKWYEPAVSPSLQLGLWPGSHVVDSTIYFFPPLDVAECYNTNIDKWPKAPTEELTLHISLHEENLQSIQRCYLSQQRAWLSCTALGQHTTGSHPHFQTTAAKDLEWDAPNQRTSLMPTTFV